MKLATSIPPRRDGTVIVRDRDGAPHVFVRGESGELECEITDEALAAQLLTGGLFYPANPEDYDAALKLTGEDRTDDDADDADDADGIEDAGAGGLPIEANTQPVASKPAKAGRKATK